jgi:nucleoside-diphosphate-sugar epimerase
MNYLVTGGAGFIGSHLVDKLLKDFDNRVTVIDGHSDRIIVVDNMYEGKYSNLKKDPRLTVYNTDILGDIGHLFKNIDVVFHLAALTRPQWSILHPFETNRVNVDGTIKILEHCRDNKVKKIVFMSSSNLYGEQGMEAMQEDMKPNPLNAYALTKLIGEQYCELFEKLYGLKWCAVRPFNAYGTRMPLTGIYTCAVAMFIDVLKKGLPVHITGTGEQRRDYIYVDDLVDMLISCAHSEVSGEAFNCGSGTNTSINEIFEKISGIMGIKSKPIYTPAVFEPTQTLGDISKAKKLLGWEPKISLEEGLRRTIEGTV